MLRYQEDNELHLDFHGTANTTLDYIAGKYGVEALKEILRRTGSRVYRSIREKLAAGDASELIEHLNWFYHREGAEYDLRVTDREIRFELFECPAHRRLKQLGLPVSPYSCLQTSEINAGICEGTPWTSECRMLENGHCVQIFRREDPHAAK